MKYIVKVSYHYFTFNTRDEALDFAELAFNSADEEISVVIQLDRDPEPETGLPEEDQNEAPEEVSDNE